MTDDADAAARRALVERRRRWSHARITPVDRRAGMRLSLAQQRMLSWRAQTPGDAMGTQVYALRLEGRLASVAVERAWRATIARHEPLRVHFTYVDGAPRAIPADPGLFSMPTIDLTDDPDRDATVAAEIAAEATRPFDLARAIPLRVTLYRLRPDEHVMIVAVDHIVSDGESYAVLMRDWTELLRADLDGRPPVLPALAFSHFDVVGLMDSMIGPAELEAQRAYWREQLADPPKLDLLPGICDVDPDGRGFQPDWHQVTVSAELAGKVRALALSLRGNLNIALMCVHATLLGLWSGQRDLLVTSLDSGRSLRGTADLMGPFILMTLYRLRGGRGDTPRALLASACRTVVEAHVHQDVPIEELAQLVRPDPDLLARKPFAHAHFVYGRFVPPTVRHDALAISAMPGGLPIVKKPLTARAMDGTAATGEVKIGLSYLSAFIRTSTIERMGADHVALLGRFVTRPDDPIGDDEFRRPPRAP